MTTVSVQSQQSRDDVDSEMMMIGEDLQVTASTLEVDYDKNLTELYQAITDQDWSRAGSICKKDPIQAAIWVVRHYNEDNNENQSAMSPEQEPEIMWRFLPLHSACARQPPYDTLVALLNAYPDAAKCVDDQGMYALHYACGNQADESVIRLLLSSFLKAASIPDPRGMLPLHYTACWGPSSTALDQGVLNLLIDAYPAALTVRDQDGNIPLDLAMDGDYPEKNAVADTLRQWSKKHSMIPSNGSTDFSAASSQKKRSQMMNIRKTRSNGSDYNDAIVIDSTKSKGQLEPPEIMTVAPKTTLHDAVAATMEILNQQSQHESRASPPLIPKKKSFSSKSPTPSSLPTKMTNRDMNLVDHQKPEVETVVSVSSTDQFIRSIDESVANNTTESLQSELSAVLAKFAIAQADLNKKNDQVGALERELDATKILLEESKLECSDLKQSLYDLTEQHENVKRKSANTHDRLSTLSISLDSMKEQQSILTKIVSERNGHYQNITVQRQELFEKLLKMDKEIADNESHIDTSLKKQTREMEAISAVINAALD